MTQKRSVIVIVAEQGGKVSIVNSAVIQSYEGVTQYKTQYSQQQLLPSISFFKSFLVFYKIGSGIIESAFQLRPFRFRFLFFQQIHIINLPGVLLQQL
jgi:hypothetical protein